MGIVIRESIKSTIASYIGVIVGTINVLFLYTNFLSPEQLGLTRVLQDTTLLFISFAQLGSPNLIIKFFPHFKDKKNKHNGFLFFTVFYTLLGFIFFTILFLIFKDSILNAYISKSPLIVEYLYLVFPLGLGIILMNIFESYIVVHSKVVFTTVMREIFIKLSNTILIILLAFATIDFTQFLYLLILAYFIAAVIQIFYIKKFFVFSLKPNFSIFKSPKLKQLYNYGLFTLLGGIGYLLTTKIDIIMLPAYEGLKQTAVYTIAILIATLLEIPKKTLSQAILGTLSFAIKENDNNKIEYLYKRSSINLFIFGSLLFMIIWFNTNELYLIMPKGDIYRTGEIILLLFLAGKILDLLTGINSEIILYSKYYRYSILFMTFLGVLTVITNLIFIPLYGILGAAFATLLSLIIYMIARIFFVWIKFKMHPFNINTLKHFITFIIFILLFSFINPVITNFINNLFPYTNKLFTSVLIITIKSTVLISTFSLVIYKLKISEEFNNLLIQAKNKFKNIF